jgi:integrase/recombinase XerD
MSESKDPGFYAKSISKEYRKNAFHSDTYLSAENKKAVESFINSWKARSGIKDKRIAKYYANFRMILKLADKGFNLEDASEKHLEELVCKINESSYSEWTKTDLRSILKRYYSFKNDGVAPSKVKWIKTANPKPRHKTAEELISKEERDKLVDACQNERDRAFIMLLWEAGVRAGEMRALRVNSISFDNDGMWVDLPEVQGLTKTGGRRILTIETEPYMKNWLNVHPGKEDPTNPLWVKVERYVGKVKPMAYDNMRMMVAKKTKTAKLKGDKYNLHNFRHSSASEKASAGWNKPQMDSYFGWEPSSNQASTYIHLQEKDMVSAVRKLHGLPTAEEEKKKEKLKCQRCGRLNDANARFCNQCQVPLTLKDAIELSEKRENVNGAFDEMMEDPKFRKMFVKKLVETGKAEEILRALGD